MSRILGQDVSIRPLFWTRANGNTDKRSVSPNAQLLEVFSSWANSAQLPDVNFMHNCTWLHKISSWSSYCGLYGM